MGWWAALALVLVFGTVFEADLSRFENPDGEKHVPLFPPGQNDFSYAYLGARALIAGVNPYLNDRAEFTHPTWPPSAFGGYKQIYPPGNLLSHVPLALWKGSDSNAAGRIWFRTSLAELALLSVIVWALCRRILDVRLSAVWILLFLVCLGLNTGVELGLERGQSDILGALLIWGSIACFVCEWTAISVFLAVWSTSMKGYGVLFTVGLILLGLNSGKWKRTLAGGLVALGMFLFPVAHLMKNAAAALQLRKETFWAVWYNHSFSNLVHTLFPEATVKGRMLLTLFAVAVTAGAWLRAKRTVAGTSAAVLWHVAFGTAALATMIGYSNLSVSYNLIMVLPGVLVLVTCQRVIQRVLKLQRWSAHLLGLALVVMSFLMFSFRIGGDGPPGSGTGYASSAFGLGALLLILALLLLFGLARDNEADPEQTDEASRKEIRES